MICREIVPREPSARRP